MALAATTVGCGDDKDPGGSGDGSSGTSGGVETGSTSNDSSQDSTGVGSGSAEGSGSESSSSGEPPPVEVTVEGEVVDFVQMAAPIPDAQISIYDLPGLNALSDAAGLYSIGPFMADTEATFVLDPSTDYYGAIIPVAIGSDPIQEDQQLAQIPRDFVDLQIMLLMDQMPEPPMLDQAVIVVRLLNNTAVMEGPTTIDMDPPPVAGTYYAPDMMGAPILNQNTIEFAALPVAVFYNLPDAAPGDITFTATHPTRECEVLFPSFPTIGEHITLVDVQCLPP